MKKANAITYKRTAAGDLLGENEAMRMQEKLLKYYCDVNEIEIIGTYQDSSYGGNFDRPAFIELLKFCEDNKGAANLLLITSWDRFSRDPLNAQLMIKRLSDLGIEVKAVKQPNSLL